MDILLMIIGSFIGGLIGALTSLYFSRKSSKELQHETTRLRNLVNVLARYMHNEGVIRAEFDENRNLTQAVPLHGGVGAVGSFAGELTVGEDEPSDASDPDGPPDASAEPTATPDEVEVATALWNEYKHRHDLVWKIVFQVTTAVVILSVVPYLAPKIVRSALDGWIVAPPVLATVLVLFSLALVIHELKLLGKIRGPYWRLQKDRFGVSHETVPGTGQFLSEKWTQGFVYAYFIGLAVLSATNSVICAISWIY